ncbi:MAG: hypothetical protein ABJC33_07615 [Betaproteobacteria bacterium]
MQLRPPTSGRIIASIFASCTHPGGRLFAAALALVISPLALADTVGDARQLSHLGEPLRLSIPVRSDAGETLDVRCLSVVSPRESDGVPHILTARVAIERQSSGTQVVVSTATPMREPVTRLLLRTTCDGATRVYTLFLDPPGSGRVIRAIGRPGPRLSDTGTSAATAAGGAIPTPEPTPGAAPAVTVIPVIQAGNRATPVANPVQPAPAASAPGVRAASRAAGVTEALGGATPLPSDAKMPRPVTNAAVAAENATLKQQVAELNGEIQRLQNNSVTAGESPPLKPTPRPPASPRTARPMPREADEAAAAGVPWDEGWPLAIALGGLAALTIGGLLWRRRRGHGSEDWALTGPPSHRMASRTSLSEEPVTFKQVGMRADMEVANDAVSTPPAQAAQVPRREASTAEVRPAPLLLQPSAEDLARDLEHELIVAEHSHSALERSHPDIVELLTRSWGTAAASGHLAAILAAGSVEMGRMSGEAVAELRLLVRIAGDLGQRNAGPARAMAITPPAPAW